MTKAICTGCRHLRETTVEAGKEHYMACGWSLPALPNIMMAIGVRYHGESESERWISRKILFEQGEKLATCETFEPSSKDQIDG